MVQRAEPFEFFFATMGKHVFNSVSEECVTVVDNRFKNGCSVNALKQFKKAYTL